MKKILSVTLIVVLLVSILVEPAFAMPQNSEQDASKEISLQSFLDAQGVEYNSNSLFMYKQVIDSEGNAVPLTDAAFVVIRNIDGLEIEENVIFAKGAEGNVHNLVTPTQSFARINSRESDSNFLSYTTYTVTGTAHYSAYSYYSYIKPSKVSVRYNKKDNANISVTKIGAIQVCAGTAYHQTGTSPNYTYTMANPASIHYEIQKTQTTPAENVTCTKQQALSGDQVIDPTSGGPFESTGFGSIGGPGHVIFIEIDGTSPGLPNSYPYDVEYPDY